MAIVTTAPTILQKELAGPGQHHLELCLHRSQEMGLAGGTWRFFCERPLHSDDHHAATLDGRDLTWEGGA